MQSPEELKQESRVKHWVQVYRDQLSTQLMDIVDTIDWWKEETLSDEMGAILYFARKEILEFKTKLLQAYEEFETYEVNEKKGS